MLHFKNTPLIKDTIISKSLRLVEFYIINCILIKPLRQPGYNGRAPQLSSSRQ
jgi:hypothetical protein